MALNMSDPAAIMAVYSSILDNENNWMLLHYINDSHDELGLYSYGSQGLEEMKTQLSDLHRVFIAFYREEVDADPGYIVINYIPTAVSGVKRARALVHSRRIGGILKRHQSIFTVDSLSLITADNVHEAIINPDTAFSSPTSQTTPTTSTLADATNKLPLRQREPVSVAPLEPLRPLRPPKQFADSTNKPPLEQRDPIGATSTEPLRHLQPLRAPSQPDLAQEMGRKSFGATYAPHVEPPNVPPVPPLPKGGGSIFSNFLRRKKDSDGGGDLPPPTPPKDKNAHYAPPVGMSLSSPPFASNRAMRHQRSRSLSDYAVISHVKGSSDVVIESEPYETGYVIPLRGKWSQDGGRPSDPTERARRRRELQMQREQEEKEALEQEARRQERIRLEKEEMRRQEIEWEARRKVEIEQEIRRITAERKRREQMEKEEEERRRQDLEERRRQDREKRVEEHRRLEQWRKEQARQVEVAARRAEENRKREELERKKRIQKAEAKFKGNTVESELTGWVTVQSKDALSWKRRYYKFLKGNVFLYRSPKDLAEALDEVELRGRVRGLKEWHEGYDDLEAILFSFVVEFKNGEHWSMYADSEEEKPGNGFSNYGRGLSNFSETPPLSAPSAQAPPFPNNNGLGHNGALQLQEDGKIYALVIDLLNHAAREGALLELSKKREQYDDLALILWHSFGVMPALLQEIVSVYPLLSPPNLTAHVSNRVCNALALLQCVASHTETRQLFLNAHIPLFLYPFLNTTSKTRPFEYLRLTSLGVIGALVKQNDNNTVIHFLLSTEIIPLCLRIMETGSELSKTVAIFIVQKILLDETGLTYICHTYERFYAVGTVLSNMVNQLVETQAVRLLKHVVRCYLRLSDNLRAREALRACLPEPLRDQTFSTLLKGDMVTKRCLTTLLNNLNEP
ncbi:hypothetical protein CVT25_009376 [Psilocybe cyanescens]|uniref:ADF-H domain-containing protein n=1 Tax=Psilocybe cyanescens TaxID=93625 RepID=A0A409XV43_PSICY|nr:hypothetical protein CVT25_009376 [Psilocybe cyanescens]